MIIRQTSLAERCLVSPKELIDPAWSAFSSSLSRDAREATCFKTKAKDMHDRGHRPKAKAENAKVNFRVNVTVNPVF